MILRLCSHSSPPPRDGCRKPPLGGSSTDVVGRARQLPVQGLAQAAVPVWSPDGKTLAFFGTRASAPTFIQPYDLWTESATGGAPRRVAANVTRLLPVGQAVLTWTNS